MVMDKSLGYRRSYSAFYMNCTFCSELKCGGFPGPGVDHHVLTNPMREYLHNDDTHVHQQFDNFKTKHGREYDSEKEHEYRKSIFRHNLRYALSSSSISKLDQTL